jgi:crotonobetainyl-CoA hydratase
MQLLVTGDPISAEEAARWGLINQVVPDGTVLDAALALADRITVNAPLAVQASKRVAAGADEGAIPGEQDAWKRSNREMRVVFTSEDAMEGPMAFAQKRAPVWKSR